jgi:hypothetical protein
MNGLTVPSPWFTGKSLSEAPIFESNNPQYYSYFEPFRKNNVWKIIGS